jgi:hypothetical protein
VLYYSFVNPPRSTPENYIDFLVASPGPASCTEAARVQPHSPFAPAHDSYNRLLSRLEPDPEELWHEAEPLVEGQRRAGHRRLDPRQAPRPAHRAGHPPLVGQAQEASPGDQSDHPAVDRWRPQDRERPWRLPLTQIGIQVTG